ncbi:hypothetical protein AV947_gp46 [Podophage Lau218]|uniref:Putative phage protein n=1 Tax=Podophage Lau218 TaxID=2784187 RepID=A0A060BK83_9CAUD|nr:hypothetical protein AV947_gp46 [Podophage Lau218]AIA83161.1 putative phage protein [Podophage Lau218]
MINFSELNTKEFGRYDRKIVPDNVTLSNEIREELRVEKLREKTKNISLWTSAGATQGSLFSDGAKDTSSKDYDSAFVQDFLDGKYNEELSSNFSNEEITQLIRDQKLNNLGSMNEAIDNKKTFSGYQQKLDASAWYESAVPTLLSYASSPWGVVEVGATIISGGMGVGARVAIQGGSGALAGFATEAGVQSDYGIVNQEAKNSAAIWGGVLGGAFGFIPGSKNSFLKESVGADGKKSIEFTEKPAGQMPEFSIDGLDAIAHKKSGNAKVDDILLQANTEKDNLLALKTVGADTEAIAKQEKVVVDLVDSAKKEWYKTGNAKSELDIEQGSGLQISILGVLNKSKSSLLRKLAAKMGTTGGHKGMAENQTADILVKQIQAMHEVTLIDLQKIGKDLGYKDEKEFGGVLEDAWRAKQNGHSYNPRLESAIKRYDAWDVSNKEYLKKAGVKIVDNHVYRQYNVAAIHSNPIEARQAIYEAIKAGEVGEKIAIRNKKIADLEELLKADGITIKAGEDTLKAGKSAIKNEKAIAKLEAQNAKLEAKIKAGSENADNLKGSGAGKKNSDNLARWKRELTKKQNELRTLIGKSNKIDHKSFAELENLVKANKSNINKLKKERLNTDDVILKTAGVKAGKDADGIVEKIKKNPHDWDGDSWKERKLEMDESLAGDFMKRDALENIQYQKIRYSGKISTKIITGIGSEVELGVFLKNMKEELKLEGILNNAEIDKALKLYSDAQRTVHGSISRPLNPDGTMALSGKIILNQNFSTLGGGMAGNVAMGETGIAAMRVGLVPVIKAVFKSPKQFFKLLKNHKFDDVEYRHMQELTNSMDTFNLSHLHKFAEGVEDAQGATNQNKALQSMALFSERIATGVAKWTMLSPATALVRTTIGIGTMRGIFSASIKKMGSQAMKRMGLSVDDIKAIQSYESQVYKRNKDGVVTEVDLNAMPHELKVKVENAVMTESQANVLMGNGLHMPSWATPKSGEDFFMTRKMAKQFLNWPLEGLERIGVRTLSNLGEEKVAVFTNIMTTLTTVALVKMAYEEAEIQLGHKKEADRKYTHDLDGLLEISKTAAQYFAITAPPLMVLDKLNNVIAGENFSNSYRVQVSSSFGPTGGRATDLYRGLVGALDGEINTPLQKSLLSLTGLPFVTLPLVKGYVKEGMDEIHKKSMGINDYSY